MVASKRNRVLAGMMLAIGFAALRSAPAAEVAAVLRAPDFKLSDQYGQSLSIQYPRESACVLIFADQRGSSQVEGWVRPLYSRYQGRVTISGVAELSSVPSALRTMIQGIFKKTIQFPVMLDWTGRVSRQHEYRGKAAAVVIVDPQGLILHRETGNANPARTAPAAPFARAIRPKNRTTLSPSQGASGRAEGVLRAKAKNRIQLTPNQPAKFAAGAP